MEGSAETQLIERRLPDGKMQIVIALSDQPLRLYDRTDPRRSTTFCGSVLSGPQSSYSLIDAAGRSTLLGMVFKPGGVLPFLPHSAAEFTDLHVSLECVWGASAADLREQILESPEISRKFMLVERWLRAQIVRPLSRRPELDVALCQFRSSTSSLSIGDIARRANLSHRRFIQVFRDAVGLSPKVFSRLVRFQQAVDLSSRATDVDWTNLAARCGYFDQSHLIHEFREFSGLSPSEYLAARTAHRNHLALAD